jgi:hypothetical protein
MGKKVYGRLTKLLSEKEAPNQEGVTKEIWQRTRIAGKPILVRHNWVEPGPVGKFERSWIEQDRKTGDYFGCIEGDIDDSKPSGVRAIKDIESGILHSWSVSVIQGNLELGPADLNREVLEGSLVPDPQEQGTQVVIRHSADGKPIPVQNISLKVYTIQDAAADTATPQPPPTTVAEPAAASTVGEPEKKTEKTEQKPVDTRAETTDPPKAVETPSPALADTPMADAKPAESASAAKAASAAASAATDQSAKKAAATPQVNSGTLKVPAAKKAAEPVAEEVPAEKEEAKDEEMEDAEEVPVVEPPKKAAPPLKSALKVTKPPAAAAVPEKKAPTSPPVAPPTPAQEAPAAESPEQEAAEAPADLTSKIAQLAKTDPVMAKFLKDLADKQKEQDEYITKIKAENEKRETEAREKAMKERAEEHAAFIAASKEGGVEIDETEMEVNMQIWQSDDPAHQIVKGIENKYISRIAELVEENMNLKKARTERPSATGGQPQFSADVLTEALKRVDPSAAAQQEPKRKVTLKAGSDKPIVPAVKPGQKIYSHSKSASQTNPVASEWTKRLAAPYVYDPTATVQTQAKLREQFKIPNPSI